MAEHILNCYYLMQCKCISAAIVFAYPCLKHAARSKWTIAICFNCTLTTQSINMFSIRKYTFYRPQWQSLSSFIMYEDGTKAEEDLCALSDCDTQMRELEEHVLYLKLNLSLL